MDNLIKINTHSNFYVFKTEDVNFMKASGAYTLFYLIDGREIKSSLSIGNYENKFNATNFFRMSRSYIINTKEIYNITKNGLSKKSIVVFNNKQEIEISYLTLRLLLEFLNKLK